MLATGTAKALPLIVVDQPVHQRPARIYLQSGSSVVRTDRPPP